MQGFTNSLDFNENYERFDILSIFEVIGLLDNPWQLYNRVSTPVHWMPTLRVADIDLFHNYIEFPITLLVNY